MSVDSGGPAFNGDKIKAWYLPGHYSKFMVEEFAKIMKKSGMEVPIILDESKKEISTEKESYQGMSLRDYYAGQAMQAYIAAYGPYTVGARENPDKCSEWAYDQADSLIARKRETEKADG